MLNTLAHSYHPPTSPLPPNCPPTWCVRRPMLSTLALMMPTPLPCR